MLTDKIDPIIYNGVKNIGNQYPIPKGIGTFIWFWTDDEGKLHTNKSNNVLYFTDSPVSIINATELSKYMNDYEGTWVLTKRKHFSFI